MNNLNKRSPIAVAIRAALFATATISAVSAPTVYAAEQDEEATEQNRVIVTGSRIRREGFESPSPVTVINAEQIERSGVSALGDILANLPQLDSTFTSQNSGSSIGTSGVGLLDLRGLGTARTLVLIDGRRHVAGSSGSGSVDVNSIPAIMIERVEIITGANAAVYGADAVTGVVNFIMKKDIEGSEIRVYSGTANDSGFERHGASFLAGTNFSDNKGHVTFAVSYDNQDELTAAERGGRFTEKWGTVPNPLDGDTIVDGIQIDDGIPDRITVPNQGHYLISDAGTIPGINGRFNSDGTYSLLDLNNVEYVDGIRCAGQGCTPLDLSTFNDLQVGFSRFSVDANFRYNLTDETELYVDTRFASVESNQQGQPSFDFGVPISIAADNAYIDPTVSALTGGTGFSLRRFHTDFGRRMEVDERDTFRIVVGAQGFINEDWEWDAYVNYGSTNIVRKNFNNRIDERFFNATDAVRLSQGDIDAIAASAAPSRDELASVSVGDVVCRSVLQEALTAGSTGQSSYANAGCVPVNLFGYGSPSQEAIDWFSQTAIGQFELQQTQAAGYVSTDNLFSTWAGDVGFVAGAEFREERSGGEEDTASGLDLTFFNNLSVSRGSYQASDFFAEMSIPLVRDVFLVQDLTLEMAARSSDYSTIGSFTTWEARLNWEINEELTFRASGGKSLRAPNISELFDPAGQNFFGIGDPCETDNIDLATNGIANRMANCAALGVVYGDNPATPEVETDYWLANDAVTVVGSSGGNAELTGEESRTSTFGFVYSPDWLENLNISIDYYDIEITQAIANTGAQAILNRCVDDPNGINNQFCSLNDRDPSNEYNVSFIRSSPVNLNTLISKGYDFEIDYSYDLEDMGKLSFGLGGSYLDERTLILNTADNTDPQKGEVGTPELEYIFNVNWEIDEWNVFASGHYIDEQLNGEQETIFDETDPNPDSTDTLYLDSKMFWDIGASYVYEEDTTFQLIINNVTDELPPFPFFGTGTGSAIYDNIGTYYSFSVEHKF
ncbi:MAG: TonB-dependent receptor [Kangiellaceae bacterium]|nr:TonB-dependent receptor [Kangiellaceae bacterium]